MNECRACHAQNPADAAFCGECGTRMRTVGDCPRCGREADPGMRFCRGCGLELTVSSGSVPSTLAGGRYVVGPLVGEGTRKRVHRGRDTRLERDVAVALVRTDDSVNREALVMARLGDHANVVTIYDVGDEGPHTYIVSRYMAGGSLESSLDAAPARRLDTPRALAVARDLVRALDHAHTNGVVHRDVKPANIWLDAAGNAALGDFGLAAEIDVHEELPFAGTPAYIAPEQAVGSAPDPRSDLYSAGCVLYEMASGHPPFEADDAVEVVSRHLRSPVPQDAAIPASLDAILGRLLAKTPDERFGSAREVLAALRAVRTRRATRTPARELEWGRFVGREDQLGRLKRHVDNAVAGRGGVVVVGGEPGVGKSRLTDETCVYARLAGMQVVRGACFESAGQLPYTPVIEALRELVRLREPSDALADLGRGAADVARLVPQVALLAPNTAPGGQGPGDPENERHRLFEHVAAFVTASARRTPVVCVLEDLHWADTPTLSLLRHLARRASSVPLLVVATYRDEGLDRRHPLASTLADLHRDRAAERVVVRGLTRDEVHDLLHAVLHSEDRPELDALADALHRDTEGNPFFIEEILRHLVESGGLRRDERGWTVDAASVEDISIPQSVREVIGRRLERLSDECNHALAHAAVLGREFAFDVLARMTNEDPERLLPAVEEAVGARIVVEVQGHAAATYAFAHALVRQTLYEELSLPRKQRMHLRAAQALEETTPDPSSLLQRRGGPPLAGLAVHYRLAGVAAPAEKALDWSLRAADAAIAVFAWEDASVHLEAALELEDERGAPPERLARLAERVGDLLSFSGLDPRRGIVHLERARELYDSLGDSSAALRLRCRLGRDLASVWAIKDLARATAHLSAAADALRDTPDPRIECRLALGLASAAVAELRVAEGRRHAERAMALAREHGDAPAWADGALLGGWLAFASGAIGEGLALLEDAWRQSDERADILNTYMAALYRGRASGHLRDPQDARAWYTRELTARAGRQGPRQRRFLVGELVAAHAASGALDHAKRLLAEQEHEEPDSPAQPVQATIAFLEGDWERAGAIWTGVRERARHAGDRWNEWIYTTWLAKLRVFEDEPDEAEALFTQALTLVEGVGVPFEVEVRANLALLLAEDARPAEAEPHLVECRRILASGEEWRGLEALVTLADGAMLQATEQDAQADAAFERSAAAFRALGLPWDEADALHCWGRALSERGDVDAACERLDGALALLRRHGAGAAWLDRVVTDGLRARGFAGSAQSVSIETVARQVRRERPDLNSHAAPDGTLTILFTDIEGSTALNEQLGDVRWVALLREHNRVVREQLRYHGGREVKSRGDGFMVVFPDPAAAVRCAVAVQRELDGGAVRVRIGIHAGQAIASEDDFFGRDVNLAARIADAAGGGEILVSDRVARSAGIEVSSARQLTLAGVSMSQPVVAVDWRSSR